MTDSFSKKLLFLLDRVNFASSLLKVEGGPLSLDLWQEKFLRDDSKFICLLKSRRVGGSWAMTLKMFIKSQLERNYNGTFVSLNLEEAKGKIEYADAMYESLPRRFRKKRVARSRTELVFEDRNGNRSSLKSLASRAPRGKGGDVGISELPHCRDSEEIYEGALHVTSRSDSHALTVESTPLGKQGVFYDIASGRFPMFHLYRIPWWGCSALCVDPERAMREAPQLSTSRRVESFGTPSMRAIYASMPEEAFRQESELAFIDSQSAAFPVELLRRNCTPDFGEGGDAELKTLRLEGIPSASHWNWLAENLRGKPVAGFDVGRKKDESVLFVMDEIHPRLEARMIVRLRNVDFTSQEKLLGAALRAGVVRLAIDSTGIGLPLAEKLQTAHGSRVLPVHFTAQAKTGMINTTRMLLLDGRLLLPLDRTLLSQLSAIEQKVTDAGNVIFTVAPSAAHHADVAWAMILACRASRETVRPAISYQSIAPRTGRFAKPATGTWRW